MNVVCMQCSKVQIQFAGMETKEVHVEDDWDWEPAQSMTPAREC